MKRFYLFFLVSALCLFSSTSIKAINGYHMLGYGTVSKGMGGVGAAYYRASIVGNNPAGRAFLGKQFTVSTTFLFPSTSYTVSGNPSGAPAISLAPGKIESDTKVLFVPNIGANWQINNNSAFGVSFYGSGIATDYPTQTFGDPTSNSTGVNFKQLYLDPSYSIKVGEKHSFGISVMLMFQSFEIKGLAPFGSAQMPFSSAPDKLSNNGNDTNFGFGFKVGYLGEVLDGLYLGAYYQSRTKAGEMKEYAGLLAEKGGLDAPSNWTVGLNYELSDKFKVLFDVQTIYFSEVKSLGNKLMPLLVSVASFDPNAGFTNTDGFFGNETGAGFGWEDMTVFKFGTEYSVNETLTFRGGYAFGEEPISESEVLFNILAPVVNNQHISIGATKSFGDEKKKDLNLALVYAPANTVKGPNPLDPAQNIELELGLFELELSLTF